MSDTPYTREEIERNSGSLPTRGHRCGKCGAYVPEFAELSKSQAEVLAWKAVEQPILVMAELRFFTGCPETWAKLWVDHGGYPFGPKKRLMCKQATGKPYDIDEILAAEEHFEGLSQLAEVLQSSTAPQNEAEINLLIGFECWGGVASDGLHGWVFNNSSAVPVMEARDAFRAVGATHCAQVMQKILDLAGKGDDAGGDDSLTEMLTQPGNEDRIRALEAEFDVDDLEGLLYDYVQEHIEEFRG